MIIKLLIIFAILYFGWRIYRFLSMPSKTANPRVLRKKEVKGVDLVEDPICHTYIPLTSVYKKVMQKNGEPAYFCSQKCFDEYKRITGQEDI